MKRGFTQVFVGSGIGSQVADERSGGSITNVFGDNGFTTRPGQSSSGSMTVTQYGSGGKSVVFTQRKGKTYINSIEVPDGTCLIGGKPFYDGEPVTYANEKLLESFPSFSLVLDSLGVKKPKVAKPPVPEPWNDEPKEARRRKCDLCHERGIATVCKPCMCAVLCVKCANGTAAIRECRRCEKPIKRIERIYFP